MKYYKTRGQADAAAKRIGAEVPSMGRVSVVFITDKQFGMIQNYEGNLKLSADTKPSQLALF